MYKLILLCSLAFISSTVAGRTNYWLAHNGIVNNAAGNQARLAAVGDGFEYAGFPLTLYDTDRYHPSSRGSLLEAMIIYATIFNDRISSIPPGSIAPVLTGAGATQDDWDYAGPIADLIVFGVPEPALLGLLGLGVLAYIRRK